MKSLGIVLLMLVGLGALVVGIHGKERAVPERAPIGAIPRGSEEPLPGAVYENGWNVFALGPCLFSQAYAEAQLLTGPPIASFDGRGWSFYVMRLACSPNNPAARTTFDNLGAQAMRAVGMVPLPDNEPHPVVRAYLLDAQQAGLDVRQTFGRVLSPPLCQQHRCRQYLDNVLLTFTPEDLGSVQLAPLGCQLNLKCARAQLPEQERTTGPRRHWPFIVVGALVLLAGCGWFVRQRLASQVGGRITI